MWVFSAALVMFLRAILIVTLVALLGCDWQPYSRSTSGVSALDKKVLYDFRDTASHLLPKLDKAAERHVLTAVSPDYYDSLLECGNDYGAPVLRIASAVTGSFTAPSAKETAYLVGVTKCGETVAEMGADINRLLVFSGNQMVASAETRSDTILKAFDLNGDGVNELLLAGGWAHGGEITTNATLVRFDKKALVTIENFGAVYHDVCGLFSPRSSERRKAMTANGIPPVAEAVVISYLPQSNRQTPHLFAERYRAPCPANPTDKPNWQRAEN